MVDEPRTLDLDTILNEKQIHHILKQLIDGDVSWELKGSEIKPAVDGIAGFLGDHMRATLHVEVRGTAKKVHLFLKCMPECKPKAELINQHNFYRREVLMYKLLEEICEDGARPWCIKAYIYTDSLVVMPDMTKQGYSARHFLDVLDIQHVLTATTSIARFHAAFVNYETKKSLALKHPYSTFREFGHLLGEPNYCDSPWLKTASKLSANILRQFSKKPYRDLPDLESKVMELYLEACDTLKEYDDTVNVLLHKDLWVNNVMYKYKNDAPTNAVLIDYQCLRYGPPAFDLMIFLYLSTDKSLRDTFEKEVFDQYYTVFEKNLNDSSKSRLEHVQYNKEDFLNWCEKGRMFGMFLAAGIYPYILMDPKTAQKSFDDPETYDQYAYEDRTKPVLEHANSCAIYKQRLLDITEEFIERYLLKAN